MSTQVAETVRVDVPRSVTRDQVIEACRVLGLDPLRIQEFSIDHQTLRAVVKVSTPSGADLLAVDVANSLVTRHVAIPVLDA